MIPNNIIIKKTVLSSICSQIIICSYFLPRFCGGTYCSEHKVFEKKLINCSTFKYTPEESVEYIYHIRFESMWAIIITSPWWYLDLFIISHSLPRFPFQTLSNEVTLVFFLMQIGNIFIIHHKILIFHITVWSLITLSFTIYDICSLYRFIISVCISIKSPCIFTFSPYPIK